MAWRTVLIQNAARVSLHKGQCLLQKEEQDYTFPLEDVIAFILESPQITLTSAFIAACQNHSVAVIICDEKHMPSGVMLPFHPHSRQSRVGHVQLGWSEALRNRIWQAIVQRKILNQADALNLKGGNASRLISLAAHVKSGDAENIEAQAARYYWRHYFTNNFTRKTDSVINAALNYGYAIVRAIIARSQVSYGLLPAFGVHHCNELNAYNLTDDVMEVLRPFVDIRVTELIDKSIIASAENATLSSEARAQLAAIGNNLCIIKSQTHTIHNAADIMTQSLVQAIEAKSVALLAFPELPEKGIVT